MDPANKNAKTIADRLLNGNLTGNTTFTLKGYSNARLVTVAGNFNGWDQLSHPMIWENGRWVCRIDLDTGKYLYKFIVDGVWILDPDNPQTEYEDHHNSVLVIEGKEKKTIEKGNE